MCQKLNEINERKGRVEIQSSVKILQTRNIGLYTIMQFSNFMQINEI